MICEKCGKELGEEYEECWFCGFVCDNCAFECFELNKHKDKNEPIKNW